MRYEHIFFLFAVSLAYGDSYFDGALDRTNASSVISASDGSRIQVPSRVVALPAFRIDSVEPAPKPASVVRGIIIDHQLLGIDDPHSRGLDDIRQLLYGTGILQGPAQRTNNHDEHWSLCYVVRSSVDSTYVLMLSDPEMGGPTHDLQGFVLSRHEPTDARCTSIPARGQVTTDNGLYLGMTLAEVRKIMGKPKQISAGVYAFEYDRTVRTYDPRKVALWHEVFDRTKLPPLYIEYDVTASLEVRVSNGRVMRLEASYIESY